MINPPSSQYLDQLRHTHEGHLRVTLYSAGVLIGELPCENVQLTIDGRAAIWRTAELSIGIDFWETETREFLEQANVQTGEVTIEHGIRWTPADEIHWVQIARLRIDALNMSLLAAGRNISAYDRALLLQEHHFPTTRPLNATYVNLIKAITAETLPGEVVTIAAGINLSLTPARGKSFGLGEDRLAALHHLAESLDAVFHNTNTGAFRLSPYDPDAPAVWDIDAGSTGVVENLVQDFTRAEQYNAVGIEYSPDEGTDADWMKYIYAWDNDPASPTYYDGPFGKRNIFFQEEYDHLPSDAEAERVARRKLDEYTGATRGLSITCAYNPLLQPGDHLTVHFPDTGEEEKHHIESITLNLGGSAVMSIETRLQRDPADIYVSSEPPPSIPMVMPELIPEEDRYAAPMANPDPEEVMV